MDNPLLFDHFRAVVEADTRWVLTTELTLRDAFALAALAGQMSGTSARSFGTMASFAYAAADAMLAQRELPPPDDPGEESPLKGAA